MGIVGKSGSGQDHPGQPDRRFYDVEEGQVLMDGVDVRDIDSGDLNRVIGIVLQEPFLFRGTI